MSKKVLKITQGALMTAVFGVLVFLNRQTAGFAEQILVYVYPLPIAVYCARYGFRDGFPAMAAMMLLAFFLGSLNYAFYASTSLLIGYVCGGCIYRGMPAKKTLVFMMLIGVVVNLADLLVVSELMGITFMDQVMEVKELGDAMMDGLTGFMPQGNPQAEQYRRILEAFYSVEFLKKIVIISMILLGILQAFCIYVFGTFIMRRMKIRVPKLNLKGGLHLPPWAGWAAGILTLAAAILLRVSLSKAGTDAVDLQSLDIRGNVMLAVYLLGLYFLMAFGLGPAVRFLCGLIRNKAVSVILTVLLFFSMPVLFAVIGFLSLTGLLKKLLPENKETGGGSGETARGNGPGEHSLPGGGEKTLSGSGTVDYLMLVNPWHALPAGYEEAIEPQLETCRSAYTGKEIRLEKRTMRAALDMIAAMKEDGVDVAFCEGYRSVKRQEEVMEKMIRQYGEEYAGSFVAVPGYSEHHTGLALDVFLVIDGQVIRDREVYLRETERWAKVHEYLTTYGFILRYPEGKRDVTGIIYEPWHFRFVGEGAAARIAMEGVTLEEYLARRRER